MRRFVFSAPPTPPRRMTGDRACRSIGIGFHRGRCVAAIKRRKVLTESGKVDFELWSIDSTPSWHHQVRQVMGTAATRSGFCPRDRNILIRNYYDIEYEHPQQKKKERAGGAQHHGIRQGQDRTVQRRGRQDAVRKRPLHPLPESKGGGGKSGGGKGTSDHREAMRDVIRPRAQSWPLRC